MLTVLRVPLAWLISSIVLLIMLISLTQSKTIQVHIHKSLTIEAKQRFYDAIETDDRSTRTERREIGRLRAGDREDPIPDNFDKT